MPTVEPTTVISIAGKLIAPALSKALTYQSGPDQLRNAIEQATKRACENYDAPRVDYEKDAPGKILAALETVADILDEKRLTKCIQKAFSKEPPAEYVERWYIQFCEELKANGGLKSYFDTNVYGEILRQLREIKEQTAAQKEPEKPVEKKTGDRVQEVIDLYADNFTKKLFLHSLSKNNVSLKQLYVPPLFSDKDEEHTWDKDKKPIEEVIPPFLTSPEQGEMQVLMINGHAAVGKTSLVSWLCYYYRENDAIKEEILGDHSLVCVRLRDLTIGEENQNGADIVLSYLGIKDKEDFDRKYGNAVLVLDGADELCMLEQGKFSIEKFLKELCGKFQEYKIIVTSRPIFFEMGKLENNGTYVSSFFLCHLNKEQREQWIKKYENCGERLEEATKDYINQLDENAAEGIADTPLGLYLLAKSKLKQELRENPWRLYHEIFRNAILETPYNKNFNGESHPVAKSEAEADFIYSFIGKVAFAMFRNQKHDEYIVPEELKKLVEQEWDDWQKFIGTSEDKDEETKELVRQCCALCAYWKDNGNGALEFYHNNIRDFFFCEYIYERVLDCIDFENTETPIDPEKFIQMAAEVFPYHPMASKENQSSTWEQTFPFLWYRLSYEQKHGRKDKSKELSLCNLPVQAGKNPLPDTLFGLTENSKLLTLLGNQSISFSFLTQLENIYLNALFLSHIWQKILCPECPVYFWNEGEQKQKENWETSFRLFSQLFTYSVEIEKGKGIGIGTDGYLQDVHLGRAHLARAHLARAHLSGAYLAGANLEYTDLEGVDLKRATLWGTHLEEANLEYADLKWANLFVAHLAGAHLAGANLEYTDLEGVDLKRANLELADLARADLEGSNLSNARNLQNAIDLEYTRNLDKALLPPYCHVKKITENFFGPGPYYEITWDTEDE